MAAKYRKSKRKKYKKVAFKLTAKQKDLVDRCSRLKNTTPNKLIKTAIRDYLQHHADMLEHDSYISENQLSLFSPENTGVQMEMFSVSNETENE
ncbi:MAG: hypothetical protein RQ866_01575 [Bacteroidales bacterium]|nr:hypothetical protein [Bacteroidales bacterium]